MLDSFSHLFSLKPVLYVVKATNQLQK